MNNKQEKIYLDKAGYALYLERIDQIRKEIHSLHAERKGETALRHRERYDSSTLVDIDRKERHLLEELGKLVANLRRIEIVKNKADTIGINDTVLIDMLYPNEEPSEMAIKLVSTLSEARKNIPEASIDSPLGSAIYGKQVGELCSYLVGNNEIQVLIKQKLVLDEPLKR